MNQVFTKKNVILLVGIIVILGICAFVFLGLQKKGENSSSLHFTNLDTANAPKGAVLGPVNQGEIPVSFPRGLIIGAEPIVSVVNGLPVNTASGTASGTTTLPFSVYALRWNSTSSMDTLYAAYTTYLKTDWNILGGNATSTTARTISARVDTAPTSSYPSTVLISIVSQGSGAVVTVDYLSKQ